MIYELKEPKFKTPLYYESIKQGVLLQCDNTELMEIRNLKCPNCEFHIGDKVVGASFYQPFACPKCKGVFVYDLRYFRTAAKIGNAKMKWQKQIGIL